MNVGFFLRFLLFNLFNLECFKLDRLLIKDHAASKGEQRSYKFLNKRFLKNWKY